MVLQIHNTTAISDKNHRESFKRMEEVAFVFYTTYIKNKGQSDPSHRPLSADEIKYYC